MYKNDGLKDSQPFALVDCHHRSSIRVALNRVRGGSFRA